MKKITGTISYERVNNLGNYSSERLGLTVEVKEGDAQAVLSEMKEFVLSNLGLTPSKEYNLIIETKPEVSNEKSNEEKSSEESNEKSNNKEEPSEKEVAEVAEKKKPKAKVKKETKPKAEITTPYSRQNELHKELLGDLLDKKLPNWRANKSKAVEASKALEGTPFLDSNGIILDSFQEKLVTLF